MTAGLGVGAENAYPAVIQTLIDSAGLPFRVVNAGLSGETSAGGLRRLEWSLQEPVSVLVVELGANDGLRGLGVDAMRSNLEAVIERTRKRYPDADIVLAGMEAPPNMGETYTRAFHAVFPELAKKYGAALVPFLLEGVAGDPALNQDDRIHPTVEGPEDRGAERVARARAAARETGGGEDPLIVGQKRKPTPTATARPTARSRKNDGPGHAVRRQSARSAADDLPDRHAVVGR